eukprot:2851238-Prymnesium_polylepis.3
MDDTCKNLRSLCDYIDDGDCDDGGPGSEYSMCDYGHDCNDCKGRAPAAPPLAAPPPRRPLLNYVCRNSCRYIDDGDCDDGGPGSEHSACNYGYDCNDCGDRGVYFYATRNPPSPRLPPSSPPSPPSPPALPPPPPLTPPPSTEGRAVSILGGTVQFTQTVLRGHSAGAIGVEGGSLTLVECGILNNRARFGGGLYVNGLGTKVKIVGSNFSSNTAHESGGALQVHCQQVVGLPWPSSPAIPHYPSLHSVE